MTRCPSWHKLKSNFEYIGTLMCISRSDIRMKSILEKLELGAFHGEFVEILGHSINPINDDF